MSPRRLLVIAAIMTADLSPTGAAAQSVAADTTFLLTTRGTDTTSIEEFVRTGNTISGVWLVRHAPVHLYTITLGRDGSIVRYQVDLDHPGGEWQPGVLRAVIIDYGPDSATFSAMRDTLITWRIASKNIYPWLGYSLVTLDLALARLRAAHADSGRMVSMNPTVATEVPPSTRPIRFIGADSALLGTATRLKVDRNGHLLGMTSGGLETRRVAPVDVMRLVAEQMQAEAPGVAAAVAAVSARHEIALASGVLDKLVGSYQLSPQSIWTITREPGGLFVKATGQPKYALYAESPTKFFLKALTLQIEFETGSDGVATALALLGGGGRSRAAKVGAPAGARPDFAGRWVMDTLKFVKHDPALLALELTLTMRADTVAVAMRVLDKVRDSTATFTSDARYVFGSGAMSSAMPGMPGAAGAQLAQAAWDGSTLVLTRSTSSASGQTAKFTERWMLDATGTTMTRMFHSEFAGREQSQTLVFTKSTAR